MPAHITHELFARQVFARAFPNDDSPFDSEELSRYAVFGAQGPDFFLHNHRTKPSGLIFGQLLHTLGYGRYVRHLIDFARDMREGFLSPIGVFITTFASHAVLDRVTHPFINYFSGWVSPDHPESDQYYNCHAFLERIIDVFILKKRGNTSIANYDFLSHFDCGETIPGFLEDALSSSVTKTYPEYDNTAKITRQVRNAYQDTRNFYSFTNPSDRENLQYAFHREKGRGRPPRRLLALFHPDRLPDLDYLNAAAKLWNHPGIAEEIHHESFFELYDRAVDEAVEPVRAVGEALDGTTSGEMIEEIVGNQNLSDGREKKVKRKLDLVRPLPLQEVLRTLYMELEKEVH